MIAPLRVVEGGKKKKKKSKGDIIEDNCFLALMLKNSNALLAQIHKQCNDQVAANRLLVGLPTQSDKLLTEIILNTVSYKGWDAETMEMDPEED